MKQPTPTPTGSAMKPAQITRLVPDRELSRLQLDGRLKSIRARRADLAVPRGGWIRAIRRALGMTLDDMAKRLDVTPGSVSRIEASEQRQTIQLDTLRRAAEALSCELAYVLIPKTPLKKTVDQQRLNVARGQAAKVRTHMSLEGQDTVHPDLQQWREGRAVARVRDRDLWKKPL